MVKFSTVFEALRKRSVFVFFCLLFILALYVYYPSFVHPPRSDCWAAAYFFHGLNNSHDTVNNWLQLFQFDPLTQVRFQPLAYPILYFEHNLFCSHFIYYHISNFILYFASILLLYKLAAYFCENKRLTAVFVGVFALLFSHFDIVSWAYHIYIIFGFCMSLLGFIFYIKFLQSGRKTFLFICGLVFLLSLLCYETFVLWPAAAIILNYTGDFNKKATVKKGNMLASSFLVIAAVYSLYALFFYLSRKFSVYSMPLISLGLWPSLKDVIYSFSAVCFNIFYNGFLINMIPSAAFPLVINENLNLGGFITTIPTVRLLKLIYYSGGLFTGVSLIMAVYLLKQKLFNVFKVIVFFLFLLFSNFFLLFYLRDITNNAVFILTQFRYLYIPNAFLVLIVLYLTDKFFRFSKKGVTVIYIILIFVLVSNIYAASRGIAVLNKQLEPLKKMLSDINTGIESKQISRENPLFISDDIVKKLPALCWNKDMGEHFMKGTYQWAFSEEEIKCFSPYETAKWVINKDDFKIMLKDNN